jgi:hypothetical protein
LLALGKYQGNLGQPQQAIELYERALATALDTGDLRLKAEVYDAWSLAQYQLAARTHRGGEEPGRWERSHIALLDAIATAEKAVGLYVRLMDHQKANEIRERIEVYGAIEGDRSVPIINILKYSFIGIIMSVYVSVEYLKDYGDTDLMSKIFIAMISMFLLLCLRYMVSIVSTINNAISNARYTPGIQRATIVPWLIGDTCMPLARLNASLPVLLVRWLRFAINRGGARVFGFFPIRGKQPVATRHFQSSVVL